jgi:hypothetical protein
MDSRNQGQDGTLDSGPVSDNVNQDLASTLRKLAHEICVLSSTASSLAHILFVFCISLNWVV